ncbi:sigma-54 interaction domain-containing protein [Woeseia oceani]|uniref:sigma-54 interaction domain-containing protein n=1 Tax=Woeseia oceani TaxID=1548547 RepID=UPI0009F339C3|nr:sigma-54 dependent transcriptional regulator [Woeseia oceani]
MSGSTQAIAAPQAAATDPSVSGASLSRHQPRHLIVVIHEAADQSRQIKELIEFMDAPQVLTATADNWRAQIGDSRLAAVFVSAGLPKSVQSRIFDGVAAIDCNVPLVVTGDGGSLSDKAAPWARILNLPNPMQIDELSAVLEEIWAVNVVRRSDTMAPGTELIGESNDMRMIRALIERVAPSQATVLITGESGTGKELIARQIHEQSGRTGEFVAINCGAIPEHLLESELFGHERGAFTGAQVARAGRFELAEGGTLFLDEIGDMPTAMQVKLLRVLQERVIERIGGTKSIPVDIRVIAATHRNLQQRIDEGTFREDLFYRLSVFPIEASPLRERPDDVPALANMLIDKVAERYGVRISLSDAALAALCDYEWPGNVRELANVIERLAVLRPHGEVQLDELPGAIRGDGGDRGEDDADAGVAESTLQLPDDGLDLKQHLATIERDMIAAALREADGVVQKAAKSLGLGRTTLVEKIRRHDLRD